ARQIRIQSALQAMQLHDAELNRDVLLARAGLLSNYDSLPYVGRALHEDLDAIRTETARLDPETAGTVGADVSALVAVVSQKLTLVEYLKSDNAVLRNSIAFFAQWMRERAARSSQPQSAADGEAASLSHVVMRFIGNPVADVAKDADAVIARVAAMS